MTITNAKKQILENKKILEEAKDLKALLQRLLGCYRDAGVSAIRYKNDKKLLIFFTDAQLGYLQKIWKLTKTDAEARENAISEVHRLNCFLRKMEAGEEVA